MPCETSPPNYHIFVGFSISTAVLCLSVASKVVWEALAQENLYVDKDRQLTAKEIKFLWVLHFDREMKCTELSAVGKENTYIADWSL